MSRQSISRQSVRGASEANIVPKAASLKVNGESAFRKRKAGKAGFPTMKDLGNKYPTGDVFAPKKKE